MMGDIGTLAELLDETAEQHDRFETAAPPHDWVGLVRAVMDVRQRGSTREEAFAAAGRYMADVKHRHVAGVTSAFAAALVSPRSRAGASTRSTARS